MYEMLITQLVLSSYLTGLIWTIQVAHYPSFFWIPLSEFGAFERFHQKALSKIVALPMLIELGLAVGMLYFFDRNPLMVTTNIVLVLLIWASTFFLSVPCHRRLETQKDPMAIKKLVSTNWIRTGLWSGRTLFLLYQIGLPLLPL